MGYYYGQCSNFITRGSLYTNVYVDPITCFCSPVILVTPPSPPVPGPLEEADFDYEVCAAPPSGLVPGGSGRQPTVGIRADPHRRFVWNGHLLAPAERQMGWEWRLYLTHGYIKQATLYLHGRHLFLTLIARRSRSADARLARG